MARRKNYPGSIDRHGTRWRVRFSVNGQKHVFYLEDVTETQAQGWAREEHRKLKKRAKRRAVGLPSSETMSGLLGAFRDDYMPDLAKGTQASYEDSLKPIKAYFVDILGDMPLEDIQARHITQYLTWRRKRNPQGKPRKKPLSNRSLEKDRAVLHLLFNVADMMELREGNPVARTKRPKAKERDPVILKGREYETLLKACADASPMLGLYAVLLGETGARCVSEALWVRWEDVDLESGFLWLDSSSHGRKTKSDRGRWVPMTRRLREAMREHFAQYRFASYASPWLFHHTEDGKNHKAGDRIRRKLRIQFTKVARECNLPEGFVAHDLRHRRATEWIAAEKNPVHVKEALGHSDLRITMRYTHLAKEHLRSLVEDQDQDERQKLKELAK